MVKSDSGTDGLDRKHIPGIEIYTWTQLKKLCWFTFFFKMECQSDVVLKMENSIT